MLLAKAFLEFLNLIWRPWPGLRKEGSPGTRHGTCFGARSVSATDIKSVRGAWPQGREHLLNEWMSEQSCFGCDTTLGAVPHPTPPPWVPGSWKSAYLTCSNRLSRSKRSGWGGGVLGWWLVLSPVPPEKLRGRGKQVPLFSLSPS